MISICIITRDEQDRLENCLEKVKDLGYEIVVVDTGSKDDTKKVASKYTDKVYDFEWCDDFSKARNFSIEKSTNEYIFVIDSDEYVTSFDRDYVEDFLLKNPEKVGRMQRKDMFVISGDETQSSITLCNRLFSKKYFQYTGIIHEQVSRIDGSKYDMEVLPIFVDHVGYVQGKEDKDAKADRNIRLLKKELDEKGEDPYILYQLGKGYYYKGDYSKSVSYFRKALEYDLDANLEYVGDLVETYGYSLLNRKFYRIALQLENLYPYFEKRCDFVFLMGLIYMNNAMFDKAVDEFKKATKYKTSSVEGTNSYLAYYNIGVIYEVQGDVKQAIKYYKKSEQYEKSKIRLKSLNHL